MASSHKNTNLNADLQGEIFGLEGELLPFDWGTAEDHSLLDTLGVGDIASTAQGPFPEASRFEGSYDQAPIAAHQNLVADHDTYSVATSDTSHMVSISTQNMIQKHS